jgi:hypothetical protein
LREQDYILARVRHTYAGVHPNGWKIGLSHDACTEIASAFTFHPTTVHRCTNTHDSTNKRRATELLAQNKSCAKKTHEESGS